MFYTAPGTAPKIRCFSQQQAFMSSSSRQIVVTSALPYANGPIHIGHMIEYVQTDIWVRFQKMRGHDCVYVCADDAHGTPIMLRAQAEGITPEALIGRMHGEHFRDFSDFGVGLENSRFLFLPPDLGLKLPHDRIQPIHFFG